MQASVVPVAPSLRIKFVIPSLSRSFVLIRSFILSFTRSFNRSLFIRSFIRLLIHSFIHLFNRSSIDTFIRSFLNSLICSFIHSFIRSFMRYSIGLSICNAQTDSFLLFWIDLVDMSVGNIRKHSETFRIIRSQLETLRTNWH